MDRNEEEITRDVKRKAFLSSLHPSVSDTLDRMRESSRRSFLFGMQCHPDETVGGMHVMEEWSRRKISRLSGSDLSRIIRECVVEVLGRVGLITEYAVPLKEFRKRVDGLRFHLAENWCLCQWCTLYSPDNPNRDHWRTELIACITNLQSLDIKNGVDKFKTLERMLVRDYDYDDPEMVYRIIHGKMALEGIDDHDAVIDVCTCLSDGIHVLIGVMSDKLSDVGEYVIKTFGE